MHICMNVRAHLFASVSLSVCVQMQVPAFVQCAHIAWWLLLGGKGFNCSAVWLHCSCVRSKLIEDCLISC